MALVACGGTAAKVSPPPAPTASAAPSASATASATASVASADAGPPADLRCEGRSCRIERANDHTFAELAATNPDLGDLEVLGGHPKTLATLAPFTKLYRFRIALCEGLADRDFGFAKGWTELTTLVVSNCDGFTSLAPLGTLPKLTDVEIINTNLRSLDGLRGAPLTRLKVQSGVTDLGALESMTRLTSLSLYDLDGVHEAPVLAKLVHLETLDILAADLVRLPDLSPLVSLKMLTVSHCPKVSEVKGLAALPSLETLILDWTGITDLSTLGKLDHVRFLHLDGTKVKDLAPLASWANLGGVIVSDDTSPALIAAVHKLKPSFVVRTARQAAAAAHGP